MTRFTKILKYAKSVIFGYGFHGKYSSWEKAKKRSNGYDSDIIFEKVKSSALKVKNGEYPYERDSVVFNKIPYERLWRLLACLLKISSKNNNKLNVLDFGGSLGSTYFGVKDFLSELDELKWNIIEQEKFVRCGRQFFEDNRLKFYNSIEECLETESPDLALLSGVLQYLEKPEDILKQILECKFEYVILDRTAFVEDKDDFITIQKVPPEIYDASYPAWFLNIEKFLSIFKNNKYRLIVDFDSEDKANIKSKFKGFMFQREPDNE